MAKLFSKTLTRLISHSHRSSSFSTTSNLSAAPQTSNLESKWIVSVKPPAKRRVGSVWLWYLAASISYGIGEAYKSQQTEVAKKLVDVRLKCLEAKPRKLNTVMNVDELGFQRVVCKGVFDVKRSIYVGPKPRSKSSKDSENGFYVITPLLPIPNEPNSVKSPVLVNRGWVPSDWNEKSLESLGTGIVVSTANESRKANNQSLLSNFWYKFNNPIVAEDYVSRGPRAMHVEVVGVIRKNETPSVYTLVNYPRSLAWFYLDVPKLAQAMGFGEDTMYIENTYKVMDESKPYPASRDVQNLILSKDLPLGYYYHTVLCFWSSMGFGEDTMYIENTYKVMDESKPYPASRDVQNLILSKDLPLGYYYHTVLCFWSSMGFGEDTMYIENTYKVMDESKPYPASRDVQNLILSKDLPLGYYYHTVLCFWSSMGFGEDTMYIENTYKVMDESKPYPASRDVQNLILSKDLPLGYYYHTVLCFWSFITPLSYGFFHISNQV
ncbi:PREDICTED: surfeit locus protein 1-like [Camelina sativa]|uniref:SURF1-like protein n=1 Tax=Camelina sativa TaxID=90675 RepID=A0ABM1R8D8_CAMSA|nr:PREDICTED: surfeit locus protein 1-like [Camelina sativa]